MYVTLARSWTFLRGRALSWATSIAIIMVIRGHTISSAIDEIVEAGGGDGGSGGRRTRACGRLYIRTHKGIGHRPNVAVQGDRSSNKAWIHHSPITFLNCPHNIRHGISIKVTGCSRPDHILVCFYYVRASWRMGRRRNILRVALITRGLRERMSTLLSPRLAYSDGIL